MPRRGTSVNLRRKVAVEGGDTGAFKIKVRM